MRVFLVLLVVVASSSSPSFGQNQDCIDRWETATQAGIVYGVGFIDGQATVEVDEATWHTLPFETRVGIVDTLICAALPEGKTLASVDLISKLTHKRLGRWSAGRLVVD